MKKEKEADRIQSRVKSRAKRRANGTFDLPTEMNAKDVMRLLNCSQSTANRRLRDVRMAYKLPAYTKVPLVIYVKYYELDLKDVVNKLLV